MRWELALDYRAGDFRLVMEERRLLTLDLAAVMARARERAAAVVQWLSQRDTRPVAPQGGPL